MSTLPPRLRWALAATLLLSALAIWWPDDASHQSVSAVVGAAATPNAQAPATMPPAVANMELVTLPVQLPRHSLSSASFDPFLGVQPLAPPTPAELPPPKPFIGPLYQPPPDPPTLDYRYLGQMTDPAGQRTVYLARGDKEVPVMAGTRLDEGYVIESIASDGIHLYYPPLHVHTVIPVPPVGQDQAAAVAANATALALKSASVP